MATLHISYSNDGTNFMDLSLPSAVTGTGSWTISQTETATGHKQWTITGGASSTNLDLEPGEAGNILLQAKWVRIYIDNNTGYSTKVTFENRVFYGFTNLTTVVFPNCCTINSGRWMFYGTQIQKYYFQNTSSTGYLNKTSENTLGDPLFTANNVGSSWSASTGSDGGSLLFNSDGWRILYGSYGDLNLSGKSQTVTFGATSFAGLRINGVVRITNFGSYTPKVETAAFFNTAVEKFASDTSYGIKEVTNYNEIGAWAFAYATIGKNGGYTAAIQIRVTGIGPHAFACAQLYDDGSQYPLIIQGTGTQNTFRIHSCPFHAGDYPDTDGSWYYGYATSAYFNSTVSNNWYEAPFAYLKYNNGFMTSAQVSVTGITDAWWNSDLTNGTATAIPIMTIIYNTSTGNVKLF